MPPTREQAGWVARVLGVGTEETASAASVASLAAKAGKIAGVPRPNAPPRQQTTRRLLDGMTAKPAPADPADMPAHVATFLPDFLVATETERPAQSQGLQAGSPVPGADQLLGIADIFAATQRAMIEWEDLLGQAEGASATIDTIEDQDEGRDESAYVDTLVSYGTRRKQTIAAEARAVKMMAQLQVAFGGLSESAQLAAMAQGGGNG